MDSKFNRICLIILDSVGIGEMPDSESWGDKGADTLGNTLKTRKVNLTNMQQLGLGNIRELNDLPAIENPIGNYGKCTLKSNGKDTTTGHWELAGIILKKAFPTFPNGFPKEVIDEFTKAAKVPGVLANVPASGTEVIKQFGAEHMATGKPIVYTSADSVFQIAAHEEVIPIERQYEICEIARKILHGETEVGRVIARPFIGDEAHGYTRTGNRHDYAVPPPNDNLLPILKNKNLDVVCVGKVASVYDSVGVTEDLIAKNNEQSISQTINALNADTRGLIFSNLVDFDMLFGHRRDAEGYARALEYFDERLPEIIDALKGDDLLIITADHGNDPTFRGSDHTREYTPLLVYGKNAKHGVNLGARQSLSDIGQTIAENFGAEIKDGVSFLNEV